MPRWYDWTTLVGCVLVGVGLWMAWQPLGVVWAGGLAMLVGIWSAYNAAHNDPPNGGNPGA